MIGGVTVLLKETDDLLAGEELDTGDGFPIPDGDTDLGWGEALLGHGDDEVGDAPGGVCHPPGSSSLEGSDCGTDTLSLALRLDSTHQLIFIKQQYCPTMKNRQSLSVVVRVLSLTLPQRLETVENALILVGKLLKSHSGQRLFPNSVATVSSFLLLYPVFQSKSSDLQSLPSDLSEMLLFRQCKLLDIPGPLKEFDGSSVHTFFLLRRGEGVQVVEEELVLTQYHEPLEEGVNSSLDVVVVVALHPLLDEVVVAMGWQHDTVTAVGHTTQALLDGGVGLHDGALLHLQHPPACLQSLRIHQFVKRLANGQVLAIAHHECGQEVIILEGVGGVTEDFAVVAIEQRQFLAAITSATDDEGLVLNPPGAEVVGQQLGDDEIDDVVIIDGEDL